jgi:hypothetical protein
MFVPSDVGSSKVFLCCDVAYKMLRTFRLDDQSNFGYLLFFVCAMVVSSSILLEHLATQQTLLSKTQLYDNGAN